MNCVDIRFFFCAVSAVIKMYSVTTLGLVRTFSYKGHAKPITQLALNPVDKTQIISASVDKHIIIWNISDASIVTVKTLISILNLKDITMPISIASFSSHESTIYIACSNINSKENKEKFQIYSLDLKSNKTSLLVTIPEAVVSIHTFKEDSKAFAICTKNSFRIYDNRSKVTYTHQFEKTITAMSLRPNQHCAAIGDISGQIWLLYYNDNTKSKLHWHSQRVNAITFTKNGNGMLSGGQENVLVSWQLGNKSKEFMPRLGSEITAASISPNFEYYATCHSDNTIRFVKTSSKEVTSVTVGLKASHNNSSFYPTTCGLVEDPRTKQMVMASVPGFLQYYDLTSDEHILDVR